MKPNKDLQNVDERRGRMNPNQRLRRSGDFRAIKGYGFSRAHPLLVVRAAPNKLLYSRFAFTVGRRVAHKAVIRNRVRRRLREIVRQTAVKSGWDLIFIARPMAAKANFANIRDAVLNLQKRAGLSEELA